jgi:hypothetical protein
MNPAFLDNSLQRIVLLPKECLNPIVKEFTGRFVAFRRRVERIARANGYTKLITKLSDEFVDESTIASLSRRFGRSLRCPPLGCGLGREAGSHCGRQTLQPVCS